MKRLSLYLFLIFFTLQTSSWADDIRDFQIEGMSVGDSLLDFVSEEKIISAIANQQYPNDKFTIYDAGEFLKLKKYEDVAATVKKNDNNYIVTSISGVIYYEELDDCLKMKTSIQNEIEKLINYDDVEEVNYSSQRDKTGNSKVYGAQYYLKPFPSVEAININCHHYTLKTGLGRNLKVSVNTHEFSYFLINEAFK